MALSANSVFEIQTGGTDTNGGGFVTGAAGTDYSQVAAKRTATGANDSTTDAVAVGTGVITSITAAFTAAIVGNIIYLQGGTGGLAAGWYQVITFTSATSITVDRNVAAGTGITMNIGGALKTPGRAGGVGLVSGMLFWLKAGTYAVTVASNNVSDGTFSSSLNVSIQGYQTTRGDLGTPPLITTSGGLGVILITITGTGGPNTVINVNLEGTSADRGISLRGVAYMMNATGFGANAFLATVTAVWIRCTATACSGSAAFGGGISIDCVAYNNTISGFGNVSGALRCIAYGNSGGSSSGFETVGANVVLTNCVAHGNGLHGFSSIGFNSVWENCIAEGNAGFGFSSTSEAPKLLNCATYNNTSGSTSLGSTKFILILPAVILGSGSFFTNAAGANFSLNNIAGQGAALRATGYPGVLPIGGTGFLDIGALQHADPAGGGISVLGASFGDPHIGTGYR